MRTIDLDDLNDLAVGAAVLGTGGGGDPYVGRLMAAEAIRRYGPVRLVDPAELEPDALVLPVGMMGAPTVMVEKLPGGFELSAATDALETFLGERAGAVMATEAGGINSTLAMCVAVARGYSAGRCRSGRARVSRAADVHADAVWHAGVSHVAGR